jgi:hypothetical protein
VNGKSQIRLATCLVCLLALIFLAGPGATPVSASAADMLSRVPRDANMVVILDVATLVKSPMGKAEGWDKGKNVGRVKTLVSASHLGGLDSGPAWELTLAEGPGLKMEAIADAYGGYRESIGGKPAAATPQDMYFVQVEPGLIARFTPGDRQRLARWLDGGTMGVSPVLAMAGTSTAPIVVALDLTDAISPNRILDDWTESEPPTLAAKEIDPLDAAAVLASITSIVLEVQADEVGTAKCVVQFSGGLSPLKGSAREVFIQALSIAGLSIGDLRKWEVTEEGSKLVMSGLLPGESVQRIISLGDSSKLSTSNAVAGSDAGGAATPADPKAAAAEATQEYFKTVSKAIDRIGDPATSMTEKGKWLAKEAQTINKLPILNVDPEAIAFGNYVSDTLLGLTGGAKTTQLKARGQTAQTQMNSGGGYGGYGGGYSNGSYYNSGYGYGNGYGYDNAAARSEYRRVQGQRAKAGMDTRATAISKASGAVRELSERRNEVRANLTQKFGVEF